MFFILAYGWDGTGYQRFFSPAKQDFTAWHGNWSAFLTSDVAITLYVMGVVIVPPMLAWMVKWMIDGERLIGLPPRPTPAAIGRALGLALGSVFVGGLGSAGVCAVLMTVLGTPLGGLASVLILAAVFAPGSIVHRLYRTYGFPDLDTRTPVRPALGAAELS